MADYFKLVEVEIDKANIDIAQAPWVCEEYGSDAAIELLSLRVRALTRTLERVLDEWKWDCAQILTMLDTMPPAQN